MEIEAKYTADSLEQVIRLHDIRALGEYRLIPLQDRWITDRYLDTEDRDLWNGGYACRRRQQDQRSLITVKGRGSAEGAVHQREEHEFEAPANTPPERWPDNRGREIVLSLIGEKPLMEILIIRQKRSLRNVQQGDRKVGQLSLDVVKMEAAGRAEASHDVEIELEDGGTIDDLRKIEMDLLELGLRPEPRSKYERALSLLEEPEEENAALPPANPDPEPSLSTEDAEQDTAQESDPYSPDGERAETEEMPQEELTEGDPQAETGEDATQVTSSGITVQELCDRYAIDLNHARHVAKMSLELFDALPNVHDLPSSRRELMETAAILHNIGMSVNPEKHHTIGRDLILFETLAEYTEQERDMLACATRFHRKRVRPQDEPVFEALPQDIQQETLALSALLRVGDALDYSGTQTCRIVSIEELGGRVQVIVDGPAAEVEAERALKKADLWNTIFLSTINVLAPSQAEEAKQKELEATVELKEPETVAEEIEEADASQEMELAEEQDTLNEETVGNISTDVDTVKDAAAETYSETTDEAEEASLMDVTEDTESNLFIAEEETDAEPEENMPEEDSEEEIEADEVYSEASAGEEDLNVAELVAPESETAYSEEEEEEIQDLEESEASDLDEQNSSASEEINTSDEETEEIVNQISVEEEAETGDYEAEALEQNEREEDVVMDEEAGDDSIEETVGDDTRDEVINDNLEETEAVEDAEDMEAAEEIMVYSSAEPTTLVEAEEQSDKAEEPSGEAHDEQLVEAADESSNIEPEKKESSKKTPGVRSTDTVAEAGVKVLRVHFEKMLAHEEGTMDGKDIEDLHDMRVATRRMRAAMRLFGPYLPKKQVSRLNKGLRQTGRALGPVRDLDVMLEKVEHDCKQYEEISREGLKPLIEDWERRRESAREEMTAYLRGREYNAFKEQFIAFLTDDHTPQEPVQEAPHESPKTRQVRHVVPALLWEHYGQVRAYETVLEGAPVETLHALRIDCKRLRYAVEFFREPMGDAGDALIKEITRAQDHLGELHDADVAADLLLDFLNRATHKESRKGISSENISVFAKYLAIRERELREKIDTFPEIWDSLNSERFHKRLGAVTAAL